MTRTALARTYRPRRFAEVAMQEHVSSTLRAAVSRGRAAHAYLFCGPRGVGKTTAARVLAMALNCPDRDDGEPCGECESCERIWSGRTSLDVVEIDAASNRGVDDARDLRERAMYAPTDDRRYKVYIIDEAHMLTREAWNALLKILEEPPPRVIFVFATTEPQKIQQAAPPILSRCQRFDFRRISVPAILDRLRRILEAEGVEADDDALIPIARRAEGGLRDAISLLDQVLSFADGRLTAADVRTVLGLVGQDAYVELFEILADRRHADVFRFVGRLLDEGYDLGEFYRGLADALRTLLIVRLEGADAADEVRADLKSEYARQAERFGVGDLLRMLAQVSELDAEGRFRKSAHPRIALEALLLRFAHLDRTVELEALLRAATGAEGGAAGGAPGGMDPGATTRHSPRTGRGAVATTSHGDVGDEAASAGGAGTRDRSAGGGAGRATDAAPRAAGPSGGGSRAAPTSTAATAVAPDDPAGAATAVLRSLQRDPQGLPPGISVFLRVARITEASEERVVLELPPGPGFERLTGDPTARRALETAFGEGLGRSVALEVRAQGGETDDGGATPPRFTAEQVKQDRLERLAREEPALRRAVEEWDLELLD